jgi:5'-methylthioadenosine nucleosidase
MPNRILIIVAMSAEAAPTISRLSLSPLPFPVPSLPYLLHAGVHLSTPVHLATLGSSPHGVDNVGTLHAGVCLSHLLASAAAGGTPYTHVLNAGTCGGFRARGCAIGTVVLPTSSAFHDRRIVIPGTPFEEYGVGLLPAGTGGTRGVVEAIEGHCTTGDSLDHCREDDEAMAKTEAAAKDMEFAALNTVAAMHGVPLLGVKVVTDLVDGDRPSHEEFMENLGTAAKSLQENVGKVIDALAKGE